MHNNSIHLDHFNSDSTSLLASENTNTPTPKLASFNTTTPVKPLGGAAAGPAALAPYYTRHWICFCILGIINNFHFVIVLSSAYSLALSFNALHLIGVISWATVILGMAARVLNMWLLDTSSYLRVLGSCVVAAVGLVMLVLSTGMSFWVAIVAICLIGAYSAMGESVLLGYLRHFSPTLIGAWGCGTGWSGVAGTLGYLLMYGVLKWSNELIYTLCVPTIIIHVLAFHYIYQTSKDHIATATADNSTTEDGLPSLPAPPQSFTARYQHIWRVFQAVRSPALHLALVYFLEYVCIVGFASSSNPSKGADGSGDWWYDNAYEILSFCYQAGVLVSRSSISFIQIRRIEWLSIAQTVNFLVWGAQAYYHFIPLPLQFVLMVWVGLMGGGMYVNVFYLLQRSSGSGGGVVVEERDRELAINLVATGYYFGIIGSSVFEIILANTLLSH